MSLSVVMFLNIFNDLSTSVLGDRTPLAVFTTDLGSKNLCMFLTSFTLGIGYVVVSKAERWVRLNKTNPVVGFSESKTVGFLLSTFLLGCFFWLTFLLLYWIKPITLYDTLNIYFEGTSWYWSWKDIKGLRFVGFRPIELPRGTPYNVWLQSGEVNLTFQVTPQGVTYSFSQKYLIMPKIKVELDRILLSLDMLQPLQAQPKVQSIPVKSWFGFNFNTGKKPFWLEKGQLQVHMTPDVNQLGPNPSNTRILLMKDYLIHEKYTRHLLNVAGRWDVTYNDFVRLCVASNDCLLSCYNRCEAVDGPFFTSLEARYGRHSRVFVEFSLYRDYIIREGDSLLERIQSDLNVMDQYRKKSYSVFFDAEDSLQRRMWYFLDAKEIRLAETLAENAWSTWVRGLDMNNKLGNPEVVYFDRYRNYNISLATVVFGVNDLNQQLGSQVDLYRVN